MSTNDSTAPPFAGMRSATTRSTMRAAFLEATNCSASEATALPMHDNTAERSTTLRVDHHGHRTASLRGRIDHHGGATIAGMRQGLCRVQVASCRAKARAWLGAADKFRALLKVDSTSKHETRLCGYHQRNAVAGRGNGLLHPGLYANIDASSEREAALVAFARRTHSSHDALPARSPPAHAAARTVASRLRSPSACPARPHGRCSHGRCGSGGRRK